MKKRSLYKAIDWWTNICRIILGITFIFSGFVKAVDPLGSVYKIEDYLEAFHLAEYIPSFLIFTGAIVLSGLEFTLGMWIFLGIKRKISTVLAIFFMGIMTPLTLYLAITNPVTDCGCFGDVWVLTNWETFIKNVILLVAAVSIFRWRRFLHPMISEKSQWIVAPYVVFFIFGLSGYCISRLPVFDFRPYKIGNNIEEGMRIPEGAALPVYETTFVLEKEGVLREFTLEEYPDSTWNFVEARTVLKRKGYEPPIHDFSLLLQDTGEDITEEVLADKGYTFLLIANRLEEADDSNIDLINEIYDYSIENGYAFYCLTSSPEEEIAFWQERTGAEYPFCFTDNITLKTIIRSNPGLLLLRNGTILNKWSHNQLPDEYVLSDRLENLPLGEQKQVNNLYVLGRILLWYFIPLLIILMADRLWLKRKK